MNVTEMKTKTFISYSGDQKEFALKLARDLRANGLNVWLDKLEIRSGANWMKEISAALESCDSFIIILSKTSIQSDHVQAELLFALQENMMIFPVLYEHCQVPFTLRSLHYSDFTGLYKKGKLELLKAMKPQFSTASVSETAKKIVLRSEPQTGVMRDEVKALLTKRGLWDQYKNPTAKGIQNSFSTSAENKIVFDRSTDLCWQAGGSFKIMRFQDAKTYVNELNTRRFASYRGWRLPTIEEAMSLLDRSRQNDHSFISPVFNPKQNLIWTADTSPDGSAWFVSFERGSCGNLNSNSAFYFVRAVRSG